MIDAIYVYNSNRIKITFKFQDEAQTKLELKMIKVNGKMIKIKKSLIISLTQEGLRAMNDLEQLEIERGNKEYTEEAKGRTASREMCVFLIMNISSLQLIPVNIIAYRSQYGSANPTRIIAPAIAATFVSSIVAVVYCKVMDRKRRA